MFSEQGQDELVLDPQWQHQTGSNPIRYKFSDLVDIPFVQQLLDSFYIATGIPYGLHDGENNIFICRAGWQKICTQFHRVYPQTELKCCESDNYVTAHLYDATFVGYKCMNGLMDYATPIIVEGQHLGTIFLGQLLHEPPDEYFFRRQAREYGFEEEAYIDALLYPGNFLSVKIQFNFSFSTQFA